MTNLTNHNSLKSGHWLPR